MRKLLAGLAVVVVLGAAGGYFGLPYYAQMRAERDIEAVFASARASGASASHGPIQFQAGSRTLTIANMSFKATGDQAATISVGRLVAANVDNPDSRRFSAGRIEITDFEFVGPDISGVQVRYRAPKIIVENIAGPIEFPAATKPADVAGATRQALAYFSGFTAQSITAPEIAAQTTLGSVSGALDLSYFNVAVRDVAGGRIGASSIERAVFNVAGLPDGSKMTAEFGKFSIAGIDVNPMIVALDPGGAPVDRYMPMYRQMAVGPIAMKVDKAGDIHIGGMTLDEAGINPSKIKLPELLTLKDLVPPPGTQATPEQVRALMGKMASLYEGLRMGKFEMRDVSMNVAPTAPFKIAAIRLANFENGKLGEISVEGLDGRSPDNGDPIRMGRLALKGFDIARMMRMTGELGLGQVAPVQMVELLACLEAIQINDIDVVGKGIARPVRVVSFDLSWGRFVGPFPSRIKLTTAATITIRPNDRDPVFRDLAAAGVTSVTSNMDVGVTWDEASQTLVASPMVLDAGNLAALSAKIQADNVSRAMFSVDSASVLAAAAGIEVGPLELSLRDAGAIDIALRDLAKAQGVTPDGARALMAEQLSAQGAQLAQLYPDLRPLVERLGDFIRTRGATLTIRMAPKAKVNLMQSITLARTDPTLLLPQFAIDAAVSKP